MDKFPRDLEDLCCHMFQRTPEQLRIKGAQIVQLVRCDVAVSEMRAQWIVNRGPPPPPMSAHTLSVANIDYTNNIEMDQKPL